jgi:flagellar protein FlgJ
LINPIDFGNNNLIDTALKKADVAEKERFEDILKEAASRESEKELREACQNFEAIFLNMMFKSMRNSIQKSDFMGESFATQVYEDMLYENFADEAAKGQGLGLGEMLYKQLSQNLKNSED